MSEEMPAQYIENIQPLFANLRGYLDDVYPMTPKSNRTYLEFGCGKFGGYVNCWKEYFSTACGLDIFDYSKTVGEGVKFLLSEDSLTIPMPDRSVDFIASHSVLEHVINIEHTLREMQRVLKIGGVSYLTVSPLYCNRRGGHIAGHNNWEHLDPSSKWFMGSRSPDEPPKVGHLNGLTASKFLAAVGKQPWRIKKYDIRLEQGIPLPDFLKDSKISRMDLFAREFRIEVRRYRGRRGIGSPQ